MSARTIYPDCPTELSEEQISAYWSDGFLAFENALSPAEVEESRQGLIDIARSFAFNDEVAEYRPMTGADSNYGGASFRSRSSKCFVQLEPGYEPSPDKLDELVLNVRKTQDFQDEAPVFNRIYTSHPRIQGVVRSLLGQAVERYQTMALVKAANGGVEKPWHQDNAYFAVENMDQVIGTWIALDDATAENGCMRVMAKAHKLGPLRHHHTFDCEIVTGRIDPALAIPVELKSGGMLVFHGNLPHQTPVNSSSNCRRALQYHYRSTSNSVISKDAYYKVFKEADGTPASCKAALPELF
ncbi:MAG: phytanoyl-CoA dioxygenase family protein [Opitutales bacterium]|nr:phytanoyl-CoA dioxygenase family protein [Opitutales bacterium]MDG2256699.1 phytanoyl-CoA dioxygenase family protein [Opitutaceae bacterium]